MEKLVKEYGGIVLFYLFIIICVIVVNARFNYLNDSLDIETSTIAYSNN